MASSLSIYQFGMVGLAAFLLGMAKGGLKGIDMLNIVLMAIVFGSKSSTGVVLPLLCVADIMAITYYKRGVKWDMLIKLIIWIVIGICIATYYGKDMDEAMFKKIMAGTVLATMVIIYFTEIKQKNLVTEGGIVGVVFGLIAGFTTMIGNLAGAFANVYFLSMRLNKNEFIGTTAAMFLCINIFKLPLQYFVWHNINADTLYLDLLLLPALFCGFFVGLKLVQRMDEVFFRKFVLTLTLIGFVLLLLQ